MPDNTLVCDSADAHVRRAREGVHAFNRLSSELAELAIRRSQQRVARLTGELEDARRARETPRPKRSARPNGCARCSATLPGGVVVVDDAGLHPRAQPRRRGDSRRPISSAGPGSASCADVLQNPTSADGDWLTRDGRRDRARRELAAAGERQDHPADGRHRDARAARAGRAQSAPERDRQDGREPGAPDPHAARGRAAVPVAVPLAARRARARQAAREGHRTAAASRSARAGHARVRARQGPRRARARRRPVHAPCTTRRWR